MTTRLILLAIAAFLIVRFLRTLLRAVALGAGGGAGGGSRRPADAVKLVRDPVCGTHLSPKGALTVSSGGTTHYFCSEECRTRFRNRA